MDLYNIFTNFILFVPLLVFVHFRGLEYINNLYHNGKEKYQKLQALRALANNNNMSIFKIIKTICSTLYSIVIFTIIQKINKSVKKIDKYHYEVTYCLAGKIYKFHTKARRGMSDVLQIINDEQKDVTEEIEPFLGPKGDFHNLEYKPSSFGYHSLTFNMTDGSVLTFEEQQVLKI